MLIELLEVRIVQYVKLDKGLSYEKGIGIIRKPDEICSSVPEQRTLEYLGSYIPYLSINLFDCGRFGTRQKEEELSL